jgi:hypothetical protein
MHFPYPTQQCNTAFGGCNLFMVFHEALRHPGTIGVPEPRDLIPADEKHATCSDNSRSCVKSSDGSVQHQDSQLHKLCGGGTYIARTKCPGQMMNACMIKSGLHNFHSEEVQDTRMDRRVEGRKKKGVGWGVLFFFLVGRI